MDVVDDGDQRLVLRQSLEKETRRPEDLLGSCGLGRDADGAQQSLSRERAVRVVVQELAEAG